MVLVRAPHGGCVPPQPVSRPPHPSQTLANAMVDFLGSLRGAQGIREPPGTIWSALDDHRMEFPKIFKNVSFYKNPCILGHQLRDRTHVVSGTELVGALLLSIKK